MLLEETKRMLIDTIIPFWKSMRDDENGGYFGWKGFDLKTDRRAVKGCILNSRILWFFSSAAMALDRADLKAEADHAFAFLKEFCLDRQNGGVFWSVNYDGTVCDDTKHTYNQAFAIYALSAYYRLTRREEALGLARGIYHLIEDHCTDAAGYLESFDRGFRPVSNDKLSEHGVRAEKTMNTLLHVFESYSGLYRAASDADVAQSMRRILNIFLSKVYNPKKKRLEVFFDRGMNSILDLHSYGHDIEASWLLDRGCSLLGDKSLYQQITPVTSVLAEQVFGTAYHKHSVWNECLRGENDKMRIWWVQAESVLGFLNAYQKDPDRTEFLRAAADVFRYIKTVMTDPRPDSEWFWQVGDDGRPDSGKPIVEPWKCPYHNGRMCLEILRRNVDAES